MAMRSMPARGISVVDAASGIARAEHPLQKAGMIDALFRLTYFVGYRCARLVWRFTSPKVHGALVAVWHDGHVMMVRHSYRTEWSFPGGGIDAGEAPLDAAVRELREELGWRVPPSKLHPAGSVELRWHHRIDDVSFFRLDIATVPKIEIDRREVTATRFFSVEDALRLPLLPHIRLLLEGRLQAPDPSVDVANASATIARLPPTVR